MLELTARSRKDVDVCPHCKAAGLQRLIWEFCDADLVRWMAKRDLVVPGNLPLERACADGTLICKLVASLQACNMAGVEWKPVSRAAALHNVTKVGSLLCCASYDSGFLEIIEKMDMTGLIVLSMFSNFCILFFNEIIEFGIWQLVSFREIKGIVLAV